MHFWPYFCTSLASLRKSMRKSCGGAEGGSGVRGAAWGESASRTEGRARGPPLPSPPPWRRRRRSPGRGAVRRGPFVSERSGRGRRGGALRWTTSAACASCTRGRTPSSSRSAPSSRRAAASGSAGCAARTRYASRASRPASAALPNVVEGNVAAHDRERLLERRAHLRRGRGRGVRELRRRSAADLRRIARRNCAPELRGGQQNCAGAPSRGGERRRSRRRCVR